MNLIIYTNILTPYRKHFYDSLYRQCQKNGDCFHVIVMAETEPDRVWSYEEYKTEYTILLKHKTVTVSGAYIHFNRGLKRTLRALAPDVIICAGGYLCPGVWQAAGYGKKHSCRVYYWSESHLEEVKQRHSAAIALREQMRKSIYRKFNGFWYAGELSKQLIQKYALDGADYVFVPNLIEEKKFEKASLAGDAEKSAIRSRLHLPSGKITMLCPARLTQVKGVDRFLEAFAHSGVKDRFCLLVAGDGEQKEKIRRIVKTNQLNVKLLGFCSQDEMIDLYTISDILLLPSLSDPNPLSCIEALWSGLPLLLSCHCGNYPEVVRSGENGYVFRYDNLPELMHQLEQLAVAGREWYTHAGQVSKSIAAAMYDTENAVDRILRHHKDNHRKGAAD